MSVYFNLIHLGEFISSIKILMESIKYIWDILLYYIDPQIKKFIFTNYHTVLLIMIISTVFYLCIKKITAANDYIIRYIVADINSRTVILPGHTADVKDYTSGFRTNNVHSSFNNDLVKLWHNDVVNYKLIFLRNFFQNNDILLENKYLIKIIYTAQECNCIIMVTNDDKVIYEENGVLMEDISRKGHRYILFRVLNVVYENNVIKINILSYSKQHFMIKIKNLELFKTVNLGNNICNI